MPPCIVLYEPHHTGFSHSSFNAALLQTALCAYPEASVAFRGEGEHLGWVRAALEQHLGGAPARVNWVPTPVLPKNARTQDVLGPGKLAGYRRVYAEVMGDAQFAGAEVLLLCSASSLGLCVLKGLLRGRPAPVPVVGVFHEVLNRAARALSRNPVNWWFTLRRALGLPHPAGLRYVVLGPSIHAALSEALPWASRHFSSLDIPTLWTPLPEAHTDGAPVRFGYLGAGWMKHRGFGLFCQLAADLGDLVDTGRCEFVLAGFVTQEPDMSAPGMRNITGLTQTPLSADEYRRRASSITYTVWPGQSEQYALRASASFADALCMGKPGLYLRAPYVESYCAQMGDIGFLCDGYEQMRDAAVSIATEFPTERYRQQRARVLRAARAFSPETLAPRLREIAEAARTG